MRDIPPPYLTIITMYISTRLVPAEEISLPHQAIFCNNQERITNSQTQIFTIPFCVDVNVSLGLFLYPYGMKYLVLSLHDIFNYTKLGRVLLQIYILAPRGC